MPIKLNQNNLVNLPSNISVPRYNRDEITPGIIHLGVGNFHRAHMAFYLDKLFSMGVSQDWAIIGAGIRDADRKMRERLSSQDYLTTVVELEPSALSAAVVGSMVDFLPIDAQAIVSAMMRPEIRIVSLTATEGGYYVDSATGDFDTSHPDIQSDANTPEKPCTLFGMILSALKFRRENNIAPFTLLSCDNLPGNGHVLKQTLIGLARLSDEIFADWIVENVAFPNCMVDCITPATTEREIQLVHDTFGISDQAPVACEPFRQWIIEDIFPTGRPALEKVGVEFIDDVSQHELMKLRILNAGHAAIAYVSTLLGHHFVHSAMADNDIKSWLHALNVSDIIPTLEPIKGVDYGDYLDTVITRFSNTEIADTIPRLAADGSDRQPKFILPTLRDALTNNGSIDGLALEVALWARYCTGKAEDGAEISIVDPQSSELHELALQAIDRPTAFLENTKVFGDLGHDQRFVSSFITWWERIQLVGVRQAIHDFAL